MVIEINPLDTLFFRDGRPFYMGEETWANGTFPPPPSVIYGALRSAYFAGNINELNKANTDDDPTQNLKISSIYMYLHDINNETPLFPLPLDLVEEKGAGVKDKNSVYLMILANMDNDFYSNCSAPMILKPDAYLNVERVEGGLLDEISMKEYLSGENKKTEFGYIPISNFVYLEPKIGIEIENSTHTSTKSGKLYQVEMNRLKDLNIVVDFEGLDMPDEGLMKLGGEGKAVSYRKLEKFSQGVDKSALDGKRFKLYFSTPCIFSKGCLPGWLNENTLQGNYKGMELKLLAAAAGKYVPIGGFDVKNKVPKPMRRAVTAGSVYYFETVGEVNVQKIIETFHQKSISEFDTAKQGFGITFVGSV